jgi:hypothetical protein
MTTQSTYLDRNDTIAALRTELKNRTGQAWSVIGGTGTAWGWIKVTAPPKRREGFSQMSAADVATLEGVFGERIHEQGLSIPDSSDYRRNYLDAVRGLAVTNPARPYWD